MLSLPTPVDELNVGDAGTMAPALSGDGLTVYFASNRMSTVRRIWTASRTATTSPFSAPVLVDGITPSDPSPGWVSNDGCRLYFSNGGPTNGRMYVASKPPR
jgi:hypothetical protein